MQVRALTVGVEGGQRYVGAHTALRSLTSQAISLRWEMPRKLLESGRSAFPLLAVSMCLLLTRPAPACSFLWRWHVPFASPASLSRPAPVSAGCLLVRSVPDRGSGVL